MFDIAFAYPYLDSSVIYHEEHYSKSAIDCLLDEIRNSRERSAKSEIVLSTRRLLKKYNYSLQELENALFELHAKGLIRGSAYYFFYKETKEKQRDKSEFYIVVNDLELQKIKEREHKENTTTLAHTLLSLKRFWI